MKKIVVTLLLIVCISSVAFAEAGRYQLISGRYDLEHFREGVTTKPRPHYGLFKIDTKTGDVWEYKDTSLITNDGEQFIYKFWMKLEEKKETRKVNLSELE